jgi:hypothetical protein
MREELDPPGSGWRETNHYGSVHYYDELGRTHRLDGPAVDRHDSTSKLGPLEAWYRHGDRHREDGPAVTYKDNREPKWFLDGVEYDSALSHACAVHLSRAQQTTDATLEVDDVES